MRIVAAVGLLGVWLLPVEQAQCATAERHATVVVQFSSSDVRTACVGFSAAEEKHGFTGQDLLARSGLHVVFKETAVCRIENVGCSSGRTCFCKCPVATSASCRFWGYYTASRSGHWTFSNVGAASRLVLDGDADGWRWSNHTNGANPPAKAGPCKNSKTLAASPVAKHRSYVGLAAGVVVLLAFGAGIAFGVRRKT